MKALPLSDHAKLHAAKQSVNANPHQNCGAFGAGNQGCLRSLRFTRQQFLQVSYKCPAFVLRFLCKPTTLILHVSCIRQVFVLKIAILVMIFFLRSRKN